MAAFRSRKHGFGPRSRSLNSKARNLNGDKALRFESLESRQLLAADMAEILGAVRIDPQGDGNSANDAVVAGAQVSLYRDGGNGVFDLGGGDDALASTPVTTDAAGGYKFPALSAGKYFVHVAPPAGMQFAGGGSVREVMISADEADGADGRMIDGFDTVQKVEAVPPLPSSEPSALVDPAVLGGERDLYVELTNGTDQYSSVSLWGGGGLMRLASGSTVTGDAKIVWDGGDGDGQVVNPTGLGGVDLTTYNGNTMTGIILTTGADHPNAAIKMRVYTDANNWSEYMSVVPETPGGAATGHVVFGLNDAASSRSGAGADFANVGAIELTFEGVTAVDGQISRIGMIGITAKHADFTALPTLSIGDTVWNDVDNDGRQEAGEQGIAGVKLNLYADSNGDNRYSAGDALVASTTTDGAGRYLFTDLTPGDYVVQVDAMNFQSGQPLDGLSSSTGDAIDPDNDQDGDDNGDGVSAAGVASLAVSLAGGGEPTDDGDADANTNRSVDFGFFGFDLALDKAVDQDDVSPGDLLDYTVTVRNDGPSTAMDVDFADTLPSGVRFLSVEADKSGVNLSHSNGRITGSLGDIDGGDVVVIQIVAQVENSAAGLLVNEAEVVAANERNLSNNRDQVENTVTPKIDLTIVKTDSEDPVKPGETFFYTITATNNGPSNATGVEVVDHLPGDGVAFVTATPAPINVDGDEITFHLGDLAAGESATIVVTVRVEDDFTGELVNHADVEGNEEETDATNNDDQEPTEVVVDPTSISGVVYVDADDDGQLDPGERRIGGAMVELTGIDFQGTAVSHSRVTNSDGSYLFDDLPPGVYNLKQTQPTKYKDGKDSIGDNGDGVATQADGFVALDLFEGDDQDADAFEQIVLSGGLDAVDYNFGELALATSKADFVRPLFYR